MPRTINFFDSNLNSIAVLGDSRLAQQFVDTTVKLRKAAYNMLSVASMLMGQRIRWFNFAVSGLRSDQYLANTYFDQALATNAHWLMVMGIVNDISLNGASVDYWTQYVKPACLAWIAQGRRVILCTETGAASFSGTAANVGAVAKYNRQIRQLCMEQPGEVLVDVAAAVMDPTAVMAFKSNVSGDNVHINLVRGAFMAGQAIADVLTPLIPAFSPLVTTRGEVFANGGVQFFSNPTFQTTTGGTGGTGVTGTIPAGVTAVLIPAGWGCAVSTAAGAYGNDLVLAITSTGSGVARVQMDISSAESAGDVMYCNMEATVAASSTNFQAIAAYLESNRASASQQSEDGYCDPSNSFGPAEAKTLTLQTPDMTIAAGARGWLTAYARAYFNGAGSATINIRRVGVWRKQTA